MKGRLDPIALAALTCVLAVGCSLDRSGFGYGRDAAGQEIDAARPDAGQFDGGTELDSGELDASQLDAGDLDAGEADAGDLDASDLDASEADAGDLDAGDVELTEIGLDAGDLDASEIDLDAGDLDAGDLDAGDLDASAACIEGERACDGDSLVECDASGSFEVIETCLLGCITVGGPPRCALLQPSNLDAPARLGGMITPSAEGALSRGVVVAA